MPGFNNNDINKANIVSEPATARSRGFKMEKLRFRKDIGKNWSSNRVLDDHSCGERQHDKYFQEKDGQVYG